MELNLQKEYKLKFLIYDSKVNDITHSNITILKKSLETLNTIIYNFFGKSYQNKISALFCDESGYFNENDLKLFDILYGEINLLHSNYILLNSNSSIDKIIQSRIMNKTLFNK